MDLKRVIDFTAAWCGPCRTMDPIIRDFAATYVDVEFIRIDVDELEVCSFACPPLCFDYIHLISLILIQ